MCTCGVDMPMSHLKKHNVLENVFDQCQWKLCLHIIEIQSYIQD